MVKRGNADPLNIGSNPIHRSNMPLCSSSVNDFWLSPRRRGFKSPQRLNFDLKNGVVLMERIKVAILETGDRYPTPYLKAT